MRGNSLKEIFHNIYEINSTEMRMIVHAYSRNILAHALVHSTLPANIIRTVTFSIQLKASLEEIPYRCNRTVWHFITSNKFQM